MVFTVRKSIENTANDTWGYNSKQNSKKKNCDNFCNTNLYKIKLQSANICIIIHLQNANLYYYACTFMLNT